MIRFAITVAIATTLVLGIGVYYAYKHFTTSDDSSTLPEKKEKKKKKQYTPHEIKLVTGSENDSMSIEFIQKAEEDGYEVLPTPYNHDKLNPEDIADAFYVEIMRRYPIIDENSSKKFLIIDEFQQLDYNALLSLVSYMKQYAKVEVSVYYPRLTEEQLEGILHLQQAFQHGTYEEEKERLLAFLNAEFELNLDFE